MCIVHTVTGVLARPRMGAVATAAGMLLFRRAATAAPWRLTATWTARASIVDGAVVACLCVREGRVGCSRQWCDYDDDDVGDGRGRGA